MSAGRNVALLLVALCRLSGTSPAHATAIGSPAAPTCTLTDSCKDVIHDVKSIIPDANASRNDD